MRIWTSGHCNEIFPCKVLLWRRLQSRYREGSIDYPRILPYCIELQAKYFPNRRDHLLNHGTCSLSRLPLQLFDKEALIKMRNAVGQAVKADATTMAATYGRYAWVFVELGLSKPLVPSIKVFGKSRGSNIRDCISFILSIENIDTE